MRGSCSSAELSAQDLVEGYRAGTLSPLEVVRTTLHRVEEVNPTLHAFCFINADTALQMATASARRWKDAAPLGPLDGVPIAIKDTDDVRGWPTRHGSTSCINDPPKAQDSPSVARLREAGAVFFGKTTVPEFAWKGVTDSPLTGITRNPWQTSRTCGGSSGGSAVAVATGCAPLATGSDGGGSIRIPASFCGVFGLKPTTGRVPRFPSRGGDLSVHGPIGRSTEDLALMLSVMAQPDRRDPISPPLACRDWVADLKSGIRSLRVAVGRGLGLIEPQEEIRRRTSEAAKMLASAGAIVTHDEPNLAGASRIFEILWNTSVALGTLHGDAAQVDVDRIRCGQRATTLRATEYLGAQIARNQLAQDLAQFHQQYDILILPTVAILPFEAGCLGPGEGNFDMWYEWAPLTWVFNLTRQPALSAPVGMSSTGLPIGVQIIASVFREDLVLRAAFALEQSLSVSGCLTGAKA